MSLRLGNTIIPSVSVKTGGAVINNQDKTVTPTTSQQTVTADSGYSGLGTVIVDRIPTNYLIPSGNKSITSNGTGIDVAQYATVSVNVPTGSTINNQNKTVTPTTASQSITADSGYTGLGTVTVNAMPAGSAGTPTATKGTVSNHSISVTPSVTNTTGYITGSTKTGTAVTVSASELVSGNKAITANGTNIDVANYSTVSVNVPVGSTISNQNKTVTPTEAEQNITFDSGYTGLGTVTVEAISSTYIGSGVTQRTSSSLSASGATVTVPAGYYATQATKSVASGSATTPATTITANPTLSTTYTSGSGYKMSVSKTQSVTPTVSAGYVSSGTAGTITVSGSAYVAQSAITNNTTLPSGSSSSGTINEGSYLKIGAGYYPTDRYYMAQARTNGSVNNPTATKGTVSNNSVSVTPSVSYTAGYISAGSKNGTAVTVSASELVSGNKAITANGTNIDVTNYATVSVNVSTSSTPNLQEKTGITPTTSSQTIEPDSGYDGLSSVQINAISPLKSSSDLTASGATVTVPAGYYSTAASKSVTTMTLPASTSTTSSGTSIGSAIGRSTSTRYINIPAGYNSTAQYYTISAVANGSATGPTSLSGTSASISTSSNTLTLTKTGITTTPTVSAGYVSSATASTATVTLSASVNIKGATTYRASTSAQTIASNTYLTGIQTIAAVSQTNLSAANIKAGTTISVSNGSSNIWSVAGTFTSDATAAAADIASGKTAYVNGSKLTGSLSFITYYTGTSTPSSSLGSNGDIYLKTT